MLCMICSYFQLFVAATRPAKSWQLLLKKIDEKGDAGKLQFGHKTHNFGVTLGPLEIVSYQKNAELHIIFLLKKINRFRAPFMMTL